MRQSSRVMFLPAQYRNEIFYARWDVPSSGKAVQYSFFKLQAAYRYLLRPNQSQLFNISINSPILSVLLKTLSRHVIWPAFTHLLLISLKQDINVPPTRYVNTLISIIQNREEIKSISLDETGKSAL